MFKRKCMAALYTSIFAIIVLNIVVPVPSIDGGWVLGILVYSTYILPIIFIYGIITSVISDKISFKVENYSNVFSLVLHIAFGIVFIFPYGTLCESLPFLEMNLSDIFINRITILSAFIATTFFLIDCILKRGS